MQYELGLELAPQACDGVGAAVFAMGSEGSRPRRRAATDDAPSR